MSYLSNRQQFTYLNGFYTSTLPMEYGAPQGSLSGLKFFTIYGQLDNWHNNSGKPSIVYSTGLSEGIVRSETQNYAIITTPWISWIQMGSLTHSWSPHGVMNAVDAVVGKGGFWHIFENYLKNRAVLKKIQLP